VIRYLILLCALLLAGCGTNATPSQRAALLVHRGQEAEAVKVLEKHLAEHPDANPERKMLIRVLAITGDLGKAQRQAEELAKHVGPNDPSPWIEMGHAFELTHRYEDALNMYDRAAEVAPTNAEGSRTGGLRAAAWGEVELAEPRLVEALKRDPRDAEAWHALGLVRVHLEDFDGAKEAYQKGLVADPEALENRLGLATIAVAQGDARNALFHYDAIVKARPKLGDARLGRSFALIKLGRLDEAEESIRRAEELRASPRAIRLQRQLIAKLRKAGADQ
jgi:tetratricopeptide (TPR) repeat protein